MSDVDPKDEKKDAGGLVPITREQYESQSLQLAEQGEQLKAMNDRLAQVGDMLRQLPGTIGKAVADAMMNQRPRNASGPPVPLVGGLQEGGGDVEFGKGQAMKVGGQTVTEGRKMPEFRKPHSKANPSHGPKKS